MRESGSWGCSQSLFDPLFLRCRSSLVRSSRVGVSIPEALAAGLGQPRQEFLIGLLRISMDDRSQGGIGFQRGGINPQGLGPQQAGLGHDFQSPLEDLFMGFQVDSWVSRSMRRRVRDTVEWSAVTAWGA